MLIANTAKFAGCLVMLAGLHPLLAYATVGIGVAMTAIWLKHRHDVVH